MTEYSYGWENLYDAVRILASEGSLKERLKNGLIYHVVNINPEEHLPEEIRDKFNAFIKEINAQPPRGDEGSIQATVDKLEPVAVSEMVDKIISFYDTVCRYRRPN